MLVWKPSLTGIHRFHLQHPASTAATLYCMKHSPWLLSCRSPFEITSLIEILPMPVLPSSRCSDSKRVLQRYIKKKVPFLIWHVPARVATQLVFKIINNYACFNKSLLFVILSDIVCFFKKVFLEGICIIHRTELLGAIWGMNRYVSLLHVPVIIIWMTSLSASLSVSWNCKFLDDSVCVTFFSL